MPPKMQAVHIRRQVVDDWMTATSFTADIW